MNRLSTEDRVRVVRCLVEGVSIRGTVRVTGIAKNTIVKLLAELGEACIEHHDRTVRNLKKTVVLEADEVWSFVSAKDKNVPAEKRNDPNYGSIWTWTCIDADNKLFVSYAVGSRDAETCDAFMEDVAQRVPGRPQLTSDGLNLYVSAVEKAFGGRAHFAQLVKEYRENRSTEARYSPAECVGCKKTVVVGKPDPARVSTSYVERTNLGIRTNVKRYARLTNAHSKKALNHLYAFAIHVAFYNWCRRHETIRCTPAMAAGISDHVWTVEELVGLLEEREAIALREARAN